MKKLMDVIKNRDVSSVIVKDLGRIARSMSEIEQFNRLCEKHDVSVVLALQDTSYGAAIKKINIC